MGTQKLKTAPSPVQEKFPPKTPVFKIYKANKLILTTASETLYHWVLDLESKMNN